MDIFGIVEFPTWILIVLFITLYVVYYGWIKLPINELKQYGISTDTGKLPFIGPGWKLFTEGIINYDRRLYMKFKNEKVFGSMRNGKPNLMVTDLDLIKTILIKEAGTFTNRARTFTPACDITSRLLTLLVDEHWKHVRSMCTPAFSSVKMRKMEGLIRNAASNLIENFKRHEKENKPLNVKEAFGCYSMDATVSTIFGLEVNSLENPDHPVVTNTKAIMSRFAGRSIFLMILFLFPTLFKVLAFLGILEVFPRKPMKFFEAIIDRAICERKLDQDQPHTDFLQLMVQSHVSDEDTDRETNKLKWSSSGLLRNEILAQSFMFFVAGYENMSFFMTYVAYCLALNPGVQDRLIGEINQIIGKKDPGYDNVAKLEYLEMVINEAARIYTFAPRLERICKSTIEIDGILFKQGWVVSVPLYGVHMDPEIWPDPEKYDPERFSPENCKSRHPCSYLPFGIGPRHCIAQRLSLFEAKIALVSILKNFRFVPCEETPIPKVMGPFGRPRKDKPVILKLEKILTVDDE